MGDRQSEVASLALQFVASFCWAIGAALAGPSSAADILQLTAAVAWCCANMFSAWSLNLDYGKADGAALRQVDVGEPEVELTNGNDPIGERKA